LGCFQSDYGLNVRLVFYSSLALNLAILIVCHILLVAQINYTVIL
jgi:hypothetical protein